MGASVASGALEAAAAELEVGARARAPRRAASRAVSRAVASLGAERR